METLLNLLSLIGSLGLFLFGMKTMSEGLEKFAGDRLRSVLAAMTKNRVMGVLTGILVTALIQSSSATTVMVVSFVNAGLMTLAQSIGVIMGANVGTTVTAWIISLIGFKVNIAAMSLPLVAIGIPLYFSGNEKRKSIGELGKRPQHRRHGGTDAGRAGRRWIPDCYSLCHGGSPGDNARAGIGCDNGHNAYAL